MIKRLVGAVALATVAVAYSAQAADPEPVGEEPEAVWSGDAKDHAGYGPVDPATLPWTGDVKDHPGYGSVTVAQRVERSCLGTALDIVCF